MYPNQVYANKRQMMENQKNLSLLASEITTDISSEKSKKLSKKAVKKIRNNQIKQLAGNWEQNEILQDDEFSSCRHQDVPNIYHPEIEQTFSGTLNFKNLDLRLYDTNKKPGFGVIYFTVDSGTRLLKDLNFIKKRGKKTSSFATKQLDNLDPSQVFHFLDGCYAVAIRVEPDVDLTDLASLKNYDKISPCSVLEFLNVMPTSSQNLCFAESLLMKKYKTFLRGGKIPDILAEQDELPSSQDEGHNLGSDAEELQENQPKVKAQQPWFKNYYPQIKLLFKMKKAKIYQNLALQANKKSKFDQILNSEDAPPLDQMYVNQYPYPNYPLYWKHLESWPEIADFEKYANLASQTNNLQKNLAKLSQKQRKNHSVSNFKTHACDSKIGPTTEKTSIKFFDLSRVNFDSETSVNLLTNKVRQKGLTMMTLPKVILGPTSEIRKNIESSQPQKYVKISKSNYSNEEFYDKSYHGVSIYDPLDLQILENGDILCVDDFGMSLFFNVSYNVLLGRPIQPQGYKPKLSSPFSN